MKPFWKYCRFPPSKAFATAILISLASHVLVLSMPIIGDKPPPRPREGGLLTVHLTESVPPPRGQEDKKEAVPVQQQRATAQRDADETDVREDTVNLGSQDSRYRSYLLKIRKRIESQWTYPQAALENKEKGTATIKFSLDKTGALASQGIVTSSGSPVLDNNTLAVIRAAGPYDRLPVELGLSKLHIVAAFHYRLAE